MALHYINVVFLGDAGVGKSCYIRKNTDGKFIEDCIPSTGVQTSELPWTTTVGPIMANVFDIPGDHNLSTASKEALRKADAACIFFDVCNQTTLDHVSFWDQELRAVNKKSLPIVVCGNKADRIAEGRYGKPDTIQVEYYDVSVQSTLNCEEPWLWIFRQFLNNPDLEWQYAICRPISPMTEARKALMLQYQLEMQNMEREPLPDVEEDTL